MNVAALFADFVKNRLHNVRDHIKKSSPFAWFGSVRSTSLVSVILMEPFIFGSIRIARKTANINYDSVNNGQTFYVIRF